MAQGPRPPLEPPLHPPDDTPLRQQPHDAVHQPIGIVESLVADLLIGGAGEPKRLQPQLDHRENCLNLLLPFDDSPAGRELYDCVIGYNLAYAGPLL